MTAPRTPPAGLVAWFSGRARALGFGGEQPGMGILSRLHAGACVRCSITVRAGDPFPVAGCGCVARMAERAEAAEAAALPFQRARLRDGWCLRHALGVPKFRHRPRDCADCRAGLIDWPALLAEAQATAFWSRFPIEPPEAAAARRAAAARLKAAPLDAGPGEAKGRGLLDGRPGAPDVHRPRPGDWQAEYRAQAQARVAQFLAAGPAEQAAMLRGARAGRISGRGRFLRGGNKPER